jgi:hypothetical protein
MVSRDRFYPIQLLLRQKCMVVAWANDGMTHRLVLGPQGCMLRMQVWETGEREAYEPRYLLYANGRGVILSVL